MDPRVSIVVSEEHAAFIVKPEDGGSAFPPAYKPTRRHGSQNRRENSVPFVLIEFRAARWFPGAYAARPTAVAWAGTGGSHVGRWARRGARIDQWMQRAADAPTNSRSGLPLHCR